MADVDKKTPVYVPFTIVQTYPRTLVWELLLVSGHTLPMEGTYQDVAPVQSVPPHWPNCGAVGADDGADDVVVVVDAAGRHCEKNAMISMSIEVVDIDRIAPCTYHYRPCRHNPTH